MHIVPLYTALLTLLFVILSVRTLNLRRKLQIGVGDAGNPQMLRAMRVHANFAEYVPLALILLFLVEAQHANAILVHALGLALLVGRLSHAYGVSQTKEKLVFRVTGMALTFTTLLTACGYLLLCYARPPG
ncbi:MAG: hypothetical protein RL748_2531 [Pseudomonadota bacterium]